MNKFYDFYISYLENSSGTKILLYNTIMSSINDILVDKAIEDSIQVLDYRFCQVFKRISVYEYNIIKTAIEQKKCLIETIDIIIINKHEFIQIDKDHSQHGTINLIPTSISRHTEKIISYQTNHVQELIKLINSLDVYQKEEFKNHVLNRMEQSTGLNFNNDYAIRLGTIEIRSIICGQDINFKAYQNEFCISINGAKHSGINFAHVVLGNHDEIVYDKLILSDKLFEKHTVSEHFNNIEITYFNSGGEVLEKKYFVLLEQVAMQIQLLSSSIAVHEFNDKLTEYLSSNCTAPQILNKAKFVPTGGSMTTNSLVYPIKNHYSDTKKQLQSTLLLSKYNYLKGAFFPKAVGKGQAFEWIVDSIVKNSNTCTIVDTYFDSAAAIRLLKRITKPVKLTIIAGHLRQETINQLVNTLDNERQFFQCNITVYNVTRNNKEQLIHDRFIISDKVYLLSNSLSAYAQEMPFTVMPLDDETGEKIIHYFTATITDNSIINSTQIWSTENNKPKSISTLQKNIKLSNKINLVLSSKFFNWHNLSAIFNEIKQKGIITRRFKNFIYWFLNKKQNTIKEYSHFLLFCGEVFACTHDNQRQQELIYKNINNLGKSHIYRIFKYALKLYDIELLQSSNYKQVDISFYDQYNAIKGILQSDYNQDFSGLHIIRYLIHDILPIISIKNSNINIIKHKQSMLLLIVYSIRYMYSDDSKLNSLIINLINSEVQCLQVAALALIELLIDENGNIDNQIFESVFNSDKISIQTKILAIGKYYDTYPKFNVPEIVLQTKIKLINKLDNNDVTDTLLNDLSISLSFNTQLIDSFLSGIDVSNILYIKFCDKLINEFAILHGWNKKSTLEDPLHVFIDIDKIEYYAILLAKTNKNITNKSNKWGTFFVDAITKIKAPFYIANLNNLVDSMLVLIYLLTNALQYLDINEVKNKQTQKVLFDAFDSILFCNKKNIFFVNKIILGQLMYHITKQKYFSGVKNSICDITRHGKTYKISSNNLQKIFLLYLNTLSNENSFRKIYSCSIKLLSLANDKTHSIFLVNFIKLISESILNKEQNKVDNKIIINVLKKILSPHKEQAKLINFTIEYLDLLENEKDLVLLELSDCTYKFSIPQGKSNECTK